MPSVLSQRKPHPSLQSQKDIKNNSLRIIQFSSVTSHVWLFATPWTAARQASLSIINAQSLANLTSTESVMPSNHLHPLSSHSSPTFNVFQHQGLFTWVSSSHQVARRMQIKPTRRYYLTPFRMCTCSVTQSCPTLCKPMDYSPPSSSVHEILQARILEWVAMPSSRGSSKPRDQTHNSYISWIGRQVLYH